MSVGFLHDIDFEIIELQSFISSFLDRHRPCRSHNSLIAYDPDDDDDCLSSFFASFFQDLVLARVSSR